MEAIDGVPEVNDEMSDNCPMIIDLNVSATAGARSRCGDLDLVNGSESSAVLARGADAAEILGTSPSGVHCLGSGTLEFLATALAVICGGDGGGLG